MIGLLLVTLGLGQLHAFGAAWVGGWLPDPFIVVAAYAALYWPPSSLPLAALALGWSRGVLHTESAGAHVLCVWLALALVASQREAFERDRPSGQLLAALLAALTLCTGAWVLRAAFGTSVTAGLPLFTGALLVLPCAALLRRAGRTARRRA
jgi:hypothetical protein